MDIEIEYFKVHIEMARHAELQRATIGGIAAACSGGIMGELAKRSHLTRHDLSYTVGLIVLGSIALVLCAKINQRVALHNEIARLTRDRLNPTLSNLRWTAENSVAIRFPITSKIRSDIVWNILFSGVAIIGFITTIIAWRRGWAP